LTQILVTMMTILCIALICIWITACLGVDSPVSFRKTAKGSNFALPKGAVRGHAANRDGQSILAVRLLDDMTPGYIQRVLTLSQFDKVYEVSSDEYNVCVTALQGEDIVYFVDTNVTYSADFSQILYDTVFYNDSSCTFVDPTETGSTELPTNVTGSDFYLCPDYETEFEAISSIITSTSDFQSQYSQISSGRLFAKYLTFDSCTSGDAPYSLVAVAVTTCGVEWGQCNYTLIANGLYTGTDIFYTDNTCQTISSQNVADSYGTCSATDDDDSIIGLYSQNSYFGYSSNDDDDNVQLSPSAFGTLVAFVFIAFGCGGCIGYFVLQKSKAKDGSLMSQA